MMCSVSEVQTQQLVVVQPEALVPSDVASDPVAPDALLERRSAEFSEDRSITITKDLKATSSLMATFPFPDADVVAQIAAPQAKKMEVTHIRTSEEASCQVLEEEDFKLPQKKIKLGSALNDPSRSEVSTKREGMAQTTIGRISGARRNARGAAAQGTTKEDCETVLPHLEPALLANILFTYNLRGSLAPPEDKLIPSNPFSFFGKTVLSENPVHCGGRTNCPSTTGTGNILGYRPKKRVAENAVGNGTFSLRRCRYVGLRNLGATCYMNSYLQTLFMNPDFRARVLSMDTELSSESPIEQPVLEAEKNINVDLNASAALITEDDVSQHSVKLNPDSDALLCDTKKTLNDKTSAEDTEEASLHYSETSDTCAIYDRASLPGSFKDATPSDSGGNVLHELKVLFSALRSGTCQAADPTGVARALKIATHYQEDATEFATLLLMTLERQLGGDASGKNFIPELFRGRQMHRTTCEVCGFISNRTDDFYELRVQVPTGMGSSSCVTSLENPSTESTIDSAMDTESLTLSAGRRRPVKTVGLNHGRRPTHPPEKLAATADSSGSINDSGVSARRRRSQRTDIPSPNQDRPSFFPSSSMDEERRKEEIGATAESINCKGVSGLAVSSGALKPFHLEAGLAQLFQSEKLRGDNRYMCCQCEKKVDAERQVFLETLPPYLHICFERYAYEDGCRKKLNTLVEYPLLLDMKQFCSPSSTLVQKKFDGEGIALDRLAPPELNCSGLKTLPETPLKNKAHQTEAPHDTEEIVNIKDKPNDKKHVAANTDCYTAAYENQVVVDGTRTDDYIYELVGILEHQGSSALSGHYVAHLRDLDVASSLDTSKAASRASASQTVRRRQGLLREIKGRRLLKLRNENVSDSVASSKANTNRVGIALLGRRKKRHQELVSTALDPTGGKSNTNKLLKSRNTPSPQPVSANRTSSPARKRYKSCASPQLKPDASHNSNSEVSTNPSTKIKGVARGRSKKPVTKGVSETASKDDPHGTQNVHLQQDSKNMPAPTSNSCNAGQNQSEESTEFGSDATRLLKVTSRKRAAVAKSAPLTSAVEVCCNDPKVASNRGDVVASPVTEKSEDLEDPSLSRVVPDAILAPARSNGGSHLLKGRQPSGQPGSKEGAPNVTHPGPRKKCRSHPNPLKIVDKPVEHRSISHKGRGHGGSVSVPKAAAVFDVASSTTTRDRRAASLVSSGLTLSKGGSSPSPCTSILASGNGTSSASHTGTILPPPGAPCQVTFPLFSSHPSCHSSTPEPLNYWPDGATSYPHASTQFYSAFSQSSGHPRLPLMAHVPHSSSMYGSDRTPQAEENRRIHPDLPHYPPSLKPDIIQANYTGSEVLGSSPSQLSSAAPNNFSSSPFYFFAAAAAAAASTAPPPQAHLPLWPSPGIPGYYYPSPFSLISGGVYPPNVGVYSPSPAFGSRVEPFLLSSPASVRLPANDTQSSVPPPPTIPSGQARVLAQGDMIPNSASHFIQESNVCGAPLRSFTPNNCVAQRSVNPADTRSYGTSSEKCSPNWTRQPNSGTPLNDHGYLTVENNQMLSNTGKIASRALSSFSPAASCPQPAHPDALRTLTPPPLITDMSLKPAEVPGGNVWRSNTRGLLGGLPSSSSFSTEPHFLEASTVLLSPEGSESEYSPQRPAEVYNDPNTTHTVVTSCVESFNHTGIYHSPKTTAIDALVSQETQKQENREKESATKPLTKAATDTDLSGTSDPLLVFSSHACTYDSNTKPSRNQSGYTSDTQAQPSSSDSEQRRAEPDIPDSQLLRKQRSQSTHHTCAAYSGASSAPSCGIQPKLSPFYSVRAKKWVWIQFDDATVSEWKINSCLSGKARLSSRSAYLVIYKRKLWKPAKTNDPIQEDASQSDAAAQVDDPHALKNDQDSLLSFLEEPRKQFMFSSALVSSASEVLDTFIARRHFEVNSVILHTIRSAQERLKHLKLRHYSLSNELPLFQYCLNSVVFVPMSWWSAFLSGTDFPTLAACLPDWIKLERCTSNANAAVWLSSKEQDNDNSQPQQSFQHEQQASVPITKHRRASPSEDEDNRDASTTGKNSSLQRNQRSPISSSENHIKPETCETSSHHITSNPMSTECRVDAQVVLYNDVVCPHYTHAVAHDLIPPKLWFPQNESGATDNVLHPNSTACCSNRPVESVSGPPHTLSTDSNCATKSPSIGARHTDAAKNKFSPKETLSTSTNLVDSGKPYSAQIGVDPLAVWDGKVKLIPQQVIEDIFKRYHLAASIPQIALPYAICLRCCNGLSQLVEFWFEQRILIAQLCAFSRSNSVSSGYLHVRGAMRGPSAVSSSAAARASHTKNATEGAGAVNQPEGQVLTWVSRRVLNEVECRFSARERTRKRPQGIYTVYHAAEDARRELRRLRELAARKSLMPIDPAENGSPSFGLPPNETNGAFSSSLCDSVEDVPFHIDHTDDTTHQSSVDFQASSKKAVSTSDKTLNGSNTEESSVSARHASGFITPPSKYDLTASIVCTHGSLAPEKRSGSRVLVPKTELLRYLELESLRLGLLEKEFFIDRALLESTRVSASGPLLKSTHTATLMTDKQEPDALASVKSDSTAGDPPQSLLHSEIMLNTSYQDMWRTCELCQAEAARDRQAMQEWRTKVEAEKATIGDRFFKKQCKMVKPQDARRNTTYYLCEGRHYLVPNNWISDYLAYLAGKHPLSVPRPGPISGEDLYCLCSGGSPHLVQPSSSAAEKREGDDLAQINKNNVELVSTCSLRGYDRRLSYDPVSYYELYNVYTTSEPLTGVADATALAVNNANWAQVFQTRENSRHPETQDYLLVHETEFKLLEDLYGSSHDVPYISVTLSPLSFSSSRGNNLEPYETTGNPPSPNQSLSHRVAPSYCYSHPVCKTCVVNRRFSSGGVGDFEDVQLRLRVHTKALVGRHSNRRHVFTVSGGTRIIELLEQVATALHLTPNSLADSSPLFSVFLEGVGSPPLVNHQFLVTRGRISAVASLDPESPSPASSEITVPIFHSASPPEAVPDPSVLLISGAGGSASRSHNSCTPWLCRIPLNTCNSCCLTLLDFHTKLDSRWIICVDELKLSSSVPSSTTGVSSAP